MEKLLNEINRVDAELSPQDRAVARAAKNIALAVCAAVSFVLVWSVSVAYNYAQKPAKIAISSCLDQLPDVCAILTAEQIEEITQCAREKVSGQVKSGEVGDLSLIPNTDMVLEQIRGREDYELYVPSEK